MSSTATTARKFWLVYGIGTDFIYEVHAHNCRAKTRNACEPGDIVPILGHDAKDALRDLKETLAADWGGEPDDSNFKIHDCATRNR